MGAKESLQRLIEKKQSEINDLEMKIREGRAYIQALQDSLKLLPREAAEGQPALRPDSALARTRDFIRNCGKPLHISEIIKLLGKPNDKRNKVSIAGTLSSYARSGRIFTKTAPNTFGLIEFGMSGNLDSSLEMGNPSIIDTIPASFGKM